jgi:hypothetical protein
MLVAINLLAIEGMSALLLFHYFAIAGFQRPNFSYADGKLATTVLLRRSLAKINQPDSHALENRISSIPSPFFTPDASLGYTVGPGRYDVIFEQPRGKYKWRVTIDAEGRRAVNAPATEDSRQIYLFGDSFFFGWGLNDPHVFSWLLQQDFPHNRVNNYSMSGYGTVHNYLQLLRLRSRVRAQDVLIFAYGDYFNERNCAAPRRVKEIYDFSTRGETVAAHSYAHPYAAVEHGEFTIRRVSGDCRANGGWCDRPDPSRAEMIDLTRRIFDEILDATQATVVVALLRGEPDDPVLIHLRKRQVSIIDLRPTGDFFEMDDIAGFDQHAGPVAHYYYSEKAALYLRELGF